jgi:energy-coupling factor transport system ATP-binding protein
VEPIIRVEQVSHTYQAEGAHPVLALRGVNLTIRRGEYVTIVGHNGSGKSTLARHLNGLLLPTQGEVWVKGWNTRDRGRMVEIRSTVGMVFQTPDNQIIATMVEEDVAFGPENLGLPRPELVQRVDSALDLVRMGAFRQRSPHRLSGGQKQRVCIAGVLAMHPDVLVLDEATAMLDPQGRQEVLEIAQHLHRKQGVTVVAITHFMHEAAGADRVIVMADGQIVLEGPPRQLFQQIDRLRAVHLDVPPMTELALALHATNPTFPPDILTLDELTTALKSSVTQSPSHPVTQSPVSQTSTSSVESSPNLQSLISLHNLAHDYMRDTPLQVRAIHDVNMAIRRGEIVGILGHTGSGKSTIVQHFNGLLRPHEGRVTIFGHDLSDLQVDLLAVRQRVGLVFQFPETQIFEQFVGDDVAYGPRNLQLSREEVRARVRQAMSAVGLDFADFKDRRTFALSGGQKRRVAIAGVLALEPEVLVLDEPTAGLDPASRQQLLDHLLALHRRGVTLVIISHNMDELAALCQRLYVVAEGRTVLEGTPGEVFAQVARLRVIGLSVPWVMLLMERLVAEGIFASPPPVSTVEQAIALLQPLIAQAKRR